MRAPDRRSIRLICCVVGLIAQRTATESRGDETLPPQRGRVWQPVGQPDVMGELLRIGKNGVEIRAEGGKTVTLPMGKLGTEDLRYVRNLGAVTNPFRTWRVVAADDVMADSLSKQLQASYVRSWGADLKFSDAVVELILPDGRWRIFPLKIFSQEDRSYADQMRAEQAKGEREPRPKATAAYVSNYQEYHPDRDGAAVNFLESPHFLFMWGNDRNGSGKEVFADPDYLAKRRDYFEEIWDFYERQVGAPMPMAQSPEKRKINVYITGTGLPRHAEGFAFGAEAMVVHPAALGEGSSVVSHEFGHVLQFYSGGFRDSPRVGWFWECHANWSGHQYTPTYAPALDVYLQRLHFELNSTRMNYGSWPFLQWISEHPRFDRGFNYRIWLASAQEKSGPDIADPFQVIMGLGVRERRLDGNGVQGFGDLIGQTGARLAAFDFTGWYSFERDIRRISRDARNASRSRTLMEPVPDRPGWWRSMVSQSPRQYGINLIDVFPEAGASVIEAELQGIVDPTERSDWRTTLVAVDGQGQARYGRMLRGDGKLSLAVTSERERFVLAVAATPTAYRSMPERPGYGRKPRYLYEIRLNHARPRTEPEARALPPTPGGPHPNGGGFVAASASVAPTAFVGPEARVLDGARVLDRARVEDRAIVGDRAVISGNAIIRGDAVIRDDAQVSEMARVGGLAYVFGQAKLREHARVLEAVHVDGNGVMRGSALARGWGEIHLDPKTEIAGGTLFGEDLEVYMGTCPRPVLEGGRVYGLGDENSWNDLEDNHYLYAHWTFDEPHGEVLPDAFGDCTGVVRGSPRSSRQGGRGVFTFNGQDQYVVVEGHVLETPALLIEATIRIADQTAGRPLFAFVGPDSELSFTPRDDQGHAVLTIRNGKTVERVAATQATPVGKWVHISLSLGDSRGEIRLNGQSIGETPKLTLTPEDLRVRAGTIGRSADGKSFFKGQIDDITITRSALPPRP